MKVHISKYECFIYDEIHVVINEKLQYISYYIYIKFGWIKWNEKENGMKWLFHNYV